MPLVLVSALPVRGQRHSPARSLQGLPAALGEQLEPSPCLSTTPPQLGASAGLQHTLSDSPAPTVRSLLAALFSLLSTISSAGPSFSHLAAKQASPRPCLQHTRTTKYGPTGTDGPSRSSLRSPPPSTSLSLPSPTHTVPGTAERPLGVHTAGIQ